MNNHIDILCLNTALLVQRVKGTIFLVQSHHPNEEKHRSSNTVCVDTMCGTEYQYTNISLFFLMRY